MTYIVKREVKGKAYFFEVAGYRDARGKVKQKVIRYFGRTDPRKNPDAKPITKNRVVATYQFGDVALVYHAAEKLGFIDLVNRHVPKRQGLSAGLELFLTVAHRLLDDKPSSANICRWINTTFLPFFLGFGPQRVTVDTQEYLMDRLHDAGRSVDLPLKLSTEFYDAALPLFGGEENVFFYDITSTYFEGDCCPIAMLGYNRDDAVDKLQINIGMVVNGKHGIPIMTKVFEGNVNDVKTVCEMVYYARFVLGKEKGLLIMDRGMDSEANIRMMDAVGYDYIVGLRANHSFVEMLRMKNDADARGWTAFENGCRSIKIRKFSKNVFGKRRNVVLYYDPQTALMQEENRTQKINAAKSSLKQQRQLTPEKAAAITCGVKKYFVVKQTKKGVEWHLNKKELNRAKKRDGKFCLITNKNIEAAEIYKLYFSKDKIEKGFRHMKQDTSLHPTRRRLPDRVRADVFVCHLAYLLLVVAEHLAKNKKISCTWDGLSAEAKEIRLVEYQDLKGGRQFQIVANNKIQKEIVGKLGLSKYLPVITTSRK